ncbi:hypothetical protein T440DRAFT_139631 [Plenodomus tracheiphilus IPT5]|uniref:Uncharacterized protein n=1 Tax=Plenodomus tracheiphilus IPT5 TaxID=1408161 RepID=A0A6A7B438_9PLEO|nr:hypothetical protein T440DRAFT_139631 [Plenodomus tracheiphilus IPT5]
MAPKKDNAEVASASLLKGFEDRETKLIAAAFLSIIGPDKFDYDLMAVLTGNTAGSLKKMWPPVKRKAIEAHAGFGKFLGQAGTTTAAASSIAAPKAAAAKKRKDESEDEAPEDTTEPTTATATATDKADGNKSDSKKKAPSKEKKATAAKKPPGRPRKQVKKEEVEDEAMADPENDSTDGGDGVGEYAFRQRILGWMSDTDSAGVGNEAPAEDEI